MSTEIEGVCEMFIARTAPDNRRTQEHRWSESRIRSPLRAGLSVLVLLASVLWVGGSQAQPEPTRFSKPYFRVILPGSWEETSNSDEGFWVFRRADGQAQVSVTLGFTPEPVPNDGLPAMFENFSEHRHAALRAQVPACQASKIESEIYPEVVLGTYVALCPALKKYKGEVLIARSDIVASFLLETYDLAEDAFLRLFGEVRSGSALALPR